MQSFILNLFQKKFDCVHRNALISANEGYCPDCGVFVKKYFYIIRCSHCEIKREGTKKFDKFTPETKFCQNCGGYEFYVERHETISFIDIRYAIHTKEIIEKFDEKRFSQVWIENGDKVKLLKPIA